MFRSQRRYCFSISFDHISSAALAMEQNSSFILMTFLQKNGMTLQKKNVRFNFPFSSYQRMMLLLTVVRTTVFYQSSLLKKRREFRYWQLKQSNTIHR